MPAFTSTESGETLSTETDFAIAKASNKRIKRLIDVTIALVFLLTFPVHFLFVKKPIAFFSNCLAVIFGSKTWVGYISPQSSLPLLKESVLAPNGKKEKKYALPDDNIHSLNYWYARNYEPVQDIKTIFAHYKYLGN